MEGNGGRRLSPGCLAWLIGLALFLVFLGVDGLWGVQLGIQNPPGYGGVPAPTATATGRQPSSMPQLLDDPAQPDWQVPGDWYCWDSGPLAPHYLGYQVPNDHLCTWGELRSIGFAWSP